MRQGKRWLEAESAPACQVARALLVSRQSVYKKPKPRQRLRRPTPRPQLRELQAPLALDPPPSRSKRRSPTWAGATSPTATAS